VSPLLQREPAQPLVAAPTPALAEEAEGLLPAIDAQQLWFRVRLHEWSSLVVVPAGAGTSATEVASKLGEAGRLLSEGPVTVLHAESMELGAIADLVVELSHRPKVGKSGPDQQRAIISIAPVLTNPLGTGIAQSADGALLCVELQKTTLADAKATLDLVGRERFVGSVLLRPRKG